MRKKIYTAIAVLFGVLFVAFALLFLRSYLDEKESARLFQQTAQLVKVELPDKEDGDESEESEPEENESELTAYEKYADVYQENSDFIGWITIDGTNIDYPVMQTPQDKNFYIKHGFDKSYSAYGVPYMQEDCIFGVSDNCIIYGHHMNNGTMFSELTLYESRDFYEEHSTFSFDTLEGYGEYEIVAVFKTVAYSDSGFRYYDFVNAESREQFDSYVAQCKSLALYDTGVDAEYGDKLLTLSTCEYSRKNGRIVMVAKLLVQPET